MYGKIINNQLVIARNKVPQNNGWITDPSEEQLIALGYKLIEYAEEPSYDEEEQKLVQTYIENTNTILVTYEIVTLTDEEHNDVIKRKIVDEENKMTSRRQREIDLNLEGALDFAQTIENNIRALRKKFR